ncbi:MAG: hypothetical protein NZ990_09355 [Myxococcota bacterium]|nr:hypothetical protein [Myxococcota bacterium]
MSDRSGSRVLGFLFFVALFIDAALVAWVIYAAYADPLALLEVRSALFTETVSVRGGFESSPEARQASFRVDSEETMREWVERSGGDIPYLDEILALEGSATQRVRAMVPIFSRNGDVDHCVDFRDLSDTLQRIGTDDGYGCCSDHSQAFLALTSLSGMSAREMIHSDHVFAEFYEPDSGGWIWVDPQFALMARDEKGNYLSLLEIRDRYLTDEPIEFEFIGNAYHTLMGKDPKRHHYYNEASDFAVYSATWGSNVFEQDAFDRRFGFLPISVRQLVGLVAGQFPGFRTLSDERSPLPEILRRRRERLLLGAGLVLAVNLAIPLRWWAWRSGRTPGRRL